MNVFVSTVRIFSPIGKKERSLDVEICVQFDYVFTKPMSQLLTFRKTLKLIYLFSVNLQHPSLRSVSDQSPNITDTRQCYCRTNSQTETGSVQRLGTGTFWNTNTRWGSMCDTCASVCTHPPCVLLPHIQSWGQAAQGLWVLVLHTVYKTKTVNSMDEDTTLSDPIMWAASKSVVKL